MGRSREGQQIADLIRQHASSALQAVQLKFELGELQDYDPQTHRGTFELPMVLDENDVPQQTGFLPLGTLFTGPGYGMQFPPQQGDQAIIVYLDHLGSTPMVIAFFFNDVETPPFPDGDAWGWLDQLGNFVKTTTDGQNQGDGEGGARIGGVSYGSFVAPILELGAEGLDSSQQVVRRGDLQDLIDQINNGIIATFNAHVHSGVQTGSGTSAVPTATQGNLPDAEASSTVAAND